MVSNLLPRTSNPIVASPRINLAMFPVIPDMSFISTESKTTWSILNPPPEHSKKLYQIFHPEVDLR